MTQRRLFPQIVGLMVVILLLVGCQTPQATPTSRLMPPTVTSEPILPTPMPTLTPIPPTATPTRTDTPSPSPTPTMSPPQSTAPSYRAQIKISTTSDWTALRLVAGGNWHDVTVALASEQALFAVVDGDSLSLSQSSDRAEVAESVELIAEAFLTDLDPRAPLVFEIERGHIGSTQVEISSYQEGTPRVIAILTWDGISSGGRNVQVFEVSSEAFTGTNWRR